jgi:hypothetical protein
MPDVMAEARFRCSNSPLEFVDIRGRERRRELFAHGTSVDGDCRLKSLGNEQAQGPLVERLQHREVAQQERAEVDGRCPGRDRHV